MARPPKLLADLKPDSYLPIVRLNYEALIEAELKKDLTHSERAKYLDLLGKSLEVREKHEADVKNKKPDRIVIVWNTPKEPDGVNPLPDETPTDVQK